MAKKSSSSAKQKAKPQQAKAKSAKPVAKSAAKPAAKKPLAKALKKVVGKVVKAVAAASKPAPAKPAKLEKKASADLKSTKPATKPVEKEVTSKPALMTKKGKAPEPEASEPEVVEADSATPAKAEKTSKIKPIRIEKGNLDDEKAKWAELFKKYGKDKAIPYKMSDTFAAMSPVQHKVLGWGFILKNDNDRLEVLFETGIRMLISNYKS